MHIFLHDYAGHPFQTLLSRELATRGYTVTHIYFAGDQGPKGDFVRRRGDPEGLVFKGLSLGWEYSKSNFFKRRQGDVEYGRLVEREILLAKPDIVISGNTPTEAQKYILRAAQNAGSKFVYWIQDFYSVAASKILKAKIPLVGELIGRYYMYMERRQLIQSDAVIAITEAFLPQLNAWGVGRGRVAIIPNWGAIEDINCEQQPTQWQINNGYKDQKLILYSGTLALKHNPELLVSLAKSNTSYRVVVVAAGVGVDYLRQRIIEDKLDNIDLLPLQPFNVFSEVLGAATLLVGVIERDAGEYSVPSKVLSYLCAGRPILLAAPSDNLASCLIRESSAGFVVEPEDILGFGAAAKKLLSDHCEVTWRNGRIYAENNFKIDRVADKFELVISKLVRN
ncbi:glycosyltransferase family 4 protein [Zhongshania marina]|uniref:Glycosyltransferase WbuB n=1 Tax=Zhongshania marina TaxID=2304603 RepID=A0ABX9W6D9_9GAMM|nr:glycosyltransferase WbuB [Zhongshania marina]